MRKLLSAVALLLVAGTGRAAAECAASPTTLCLSASRFKVEVAWRDSHARTGVGQAVPLTSDTGYFWFFGASNIELVVKVLDARTLNGKHWVFFGALSSVEYDLTVTDSVSGASKTYHNPLGQFASVGDTSAFATPAGTAVHERVAVAGTRAPESLEAIQKFVDSSAAALAPKAAQEFTPCPDRVFGFDLGGCRFHLEVEWRDSQGREGRGQPVQLTNDTGYFWFFSPSNVELMVKVLDARPVNGNFWVFFGALSNVQYSITVTDTVTGSVKRYTNSSGSFASVGDTAAFAGGYSVRPVRDTSRSVTAELDQTGGSIVAHGADGTTFILDFPPYSLGGLQTITMTPVSQIDNLPHSGGLVGGVELEPEGLRLLAPATLTIEPSTPAPTDRAIGYAYRRGGEDLIMYPRTFEPGVIALPILRFSGYGAGNAAPGDALRALPKASASQAASGPLAPYVDQYARFFLAFLLNQITRAELTDHTIDIFNGGFTDVVQPLMRAAKDSCDKAELKVAMETAFELLRFLQIWGLAEDQRMEHITPATFEMAHDVLASCQQKAFDRCVSRNDPFEASLILYIARQLQLLGDEDPFLTSLAEDSALESCLRFELDFQSKFVEDSDYGGFHWTERLRYRSPHVPLRLDFANPYAYSSAWSGGCKLLPEIATFEYSTDICVVSVDPEDGQFDAAALWIDGLIEDQPSATVRLLYDIGDPPLHAVGECIEDGHIPDFPMALFGDYYLRLHEAEISIYGIYVAKDWELLRVGPGPSQNGWYFAKKSYERSVDYGGGTTVVEETHIFLKHTPNAPRPSDCP